jgi:hypothetical protein
MDRALRRNKGGEMNKKELRLKTISFDDHIPVWLKIGNQVAKEFKIAWDEKFEVIILKAKAVKKAKQNG